MKALTEFVDGCGKHLAAAVALPVWELATLLTIPLLLLHAGETWYFKFGLPLLCVPGLLLARVRAGSTFWLCVTIVLMFGYFNRWFEVDNHKFLTAYWTLALYCSALSKEPEGSLRGQARLLIGLCFFFATFWKAITPDYLDGRHFKLALVADARFQDIAVVAGGMPRQALRENSARLRKLSAWDGTESETQLQSTPRLRAVAGVLTWWTLGIEALLAAVFLLPDGWRTARWRHPALLVFLFTTYAFAHVVGFGWLLAIMGLVLVPPEQPRVRLAYFAAMISLYLFMLPDFFRA